MAVKFSHSPAELVNRLSRNNSMAQGMWQILTYLSTKCSHYSSHLKKKVINIYKRQVLPAIFLQTKNTCGHIFPLIRQIMWAESCQSWILNTGSIILEWCILLNTGEIPKLVCGQYLFPDINSLLEGTMWHLPTKILNAASKTAQHIYMIITSAIVRLAPANQHFYYVLWISQSFMKSNSMDTQASIIKCTSPMVTVKRTRKFHWD